MFNNACGKWNIVKGTFKFKRYVTTSFILYEHTYIEQMTVAFFLLHFIKCVITSVDLFTFAIFLYVVAIFFCFETFDVNKHINQYEILPEKSTHRLFENLHMNTTLFWISLYKLPV